MNEILGFLAETAIGQWFGKVGLFERPFLFVGLLAVVAFFRSSDLLKESTGKKVCLFLIFLGLMDLLLLGWQF